MKKILILILAVVLTFSLAACGERYEEGNVVDRGFVAIESDTALSGSYNGLVYYKKTGIVYIYIVQGYRGACAVYLSKNGLPCRYIDGEVVEITPQK